MNFEQYKHSTQRYTVEGIIILSSKVPRNSATNKSLKKSRFYPLPILTVFSLLFHNFLYRSADSENWHIFSTQIVSYFIIYYVIPLCINFIHFFRTFTSHFVNPILYAVKFVSSLLFLRVIFFCSLVCDVSTKSNRYLAHARKKIHKQTQTCVRHTDSENLEPSTQTHARSQNGYASFLL